MELVSFPRLLIFFQGQSYLLLFSPCSCRILLDLLLFHNHFEHVVFSSYSFVCPSKLCTVCQCNVQRNSSSSRYNILQNFRYLLLLPPKRNRLSLCFINILFPGFYFFSYNVPDTFFYRWFSSYSNKSLSV